MTYDILDLAADAHELNLRNRAIRPDRAWTDSVNVEARSLEDRVEVFVRGEQVPWNERCGRWARCIRGPQHDGECSDGRTDK